MKNFINVSIKFIIIGIITILLFIGIISIYTVTINGTKFDINKITDCSLNIDIYNSQGLKLKDNNSFNSTYIPLSYIPTNVKDAFVSIEDKKFYSHKGINMLRMSKAMLNNIFSLSFKEGASTITQQLIKNTHLSNEKTISRKLNEIKLAKQLEKHMSKDDILEHYLNVIYFGNNCYGIEDASQYYFSKTAKNLSLEEGAMLAGIIKSPNYYSPIKNINRATARRNIVLKEMEKDGKISKYEQILANNKDIVLKINSKSKNKLNSYSQSVLDEAVKILNMPERQIAIGKYKIYTYQDIEKQNKLNKLLSSADFTNDVSVIDIDAKNGGVVSYLGHSNYKILEHKRQIGSIAKPLFVYAPAINENIISPSSLILDEPLNISNYTPQNVNGTYQGYVSVRDALSKSLNIPAVKTASYIGLNKIKHYAEMLNLPLDEKDMSYSIALGGMTYGYNLKDVCGAYSVFTNQGKFIQPRFIKYITNKNNEIVYRNNEEKNNVFRDDTAYLITDMLKTCAKTGTARKLSEISNIEIASKTGTVGNKLGNTDAYNIAYTTEDIVGVWFGNMDNKKIAIAGGNQPTSLAKEYFKAIYSTHKPKNFIIPSSVEKITIDQNELINSHKLIKANEYTPEKYCKNELFSRFNLPKENNYDITLQPPILWGSVDCGKATIKFNSKNMFTYKVYKKVKDKTTLITTITNCSGEQNITDLIPYNQKTTYYIEANYVNSQTSIVKSAPLVLINLGQNNDIPKAKWYI